MAHNVELANRLGICEKNRYLIDQVHQSLETLISRAPQVGFTDSTYRLIESMEFYLQGLWGFEFNPNKHTWKWRYLDASRSQDVKELPDS